MSEIGAAMTESKEPPRLPEIVDEAGPTPRWVPWLGLGLLCAVVLLLVARETGLGAKLGLGAAADAAAADAAGQAGTAAPSPAAGAAATP